MADYFPGQLLLPTNRTIEGEEVMFSSHWTSLSIKDNEYHEVAIFCNWTCKVIENGENMCLHWVSYPSNVICLWWHRTELLSSVAWSKALYWMNTIILFILVSLLRSSSVMNRGVLAGQYPRGIHVSSYTSIEDKTERSIFRKKNSLARSSLLTSHSMVSPNTSFMEQWRIVNHFRDRKPYRLGPQSRSLWTICRHTVAKTTSSKPPTLLLTVVLP